MHDPGRNGDSDRRSHSHQYTPVLHPPCKETNSSGRGEGNAKGGRDRAVEEPLGSPYDPRPEKGWYTQTCIYFRKLNRVTCPDPYPMPRTEELVKGLATARYITTLDLTKGYWQVPMEEASKEKTAFVTPFGKYQFKPMPFGLTGAPATFQRMMYGLR